MSVRRGPYGVRSRFFDKRELEKRSSQTGPADSLLPAQFHNKRASFPVREAEVALMIAVLEDAIRSYVKNVSARSARGRVEFTELQRWFNARNHAGLFAFENLCDTLGINPDWLAGALHRLARQIHESRSATKVRLPPGSHPGRPGE